MEFRVYDRVTDKDVTDERDWYIDSDGNLRFLTNDIDNPLQLVLIEYYYKLEITVV